MAGTWRVWERVADSGKRAWFRWCPDCGATVAFTNEGMDGDIAIQIGAFADPMFPPPNFSVYEGTKHPWIGIVGKAVEHFD